ncbi:guanine nucleotide exchange protein for ADP-robosylation factor [Batrachochytrium dendrobatidis]|nr:guanine nucleotide exchange protein for ADP-robosylation factor [Batrachochytrium dendrobatidis]
MSSSPNGQHETSESASSVMTTETITADTPLTTQQSTHSAAASNTEISTMLYAVIIRASLLELQISSAKGNNSNSAKRVELKDACTKALILVNAGETDLKQVRDAVFLPLRLACELRTHPAVPIAIDCIGKLFSYDFWGDSIPASELDSKPTLEPQAHLQSTNPSQDRINLHDDDDDDDGEGHFASESPDLFNQALYRHLFVNTVVDVICASFNHTGQTDESTQLQIVKAITSAITTSNPRSAIHGKLLLKAMRAVYNIFLHSKTTNVQTIAQASLTQIVQTVYSHIPESLGSSRFLVRHLQRLGFDCGDVELTEDGSKLRDGDTGNEMKAVDYLTVESQPNNSMETDEDQSNNSIRHSKTASLDSLSQLSDRSASGSMPRKQSKRKTLVRTSQEIISAQSEARRLGLETVYDQHVKDAFLVFRAICKLSMKPFGTADQPTDIKSIAMRSKLLSLHLVYQVLTLHKHVFFAPAPILFSWKNHQATPTLPSVAFILAVKQYLCLVFTRNIVNVLPHVSEITMAIFGCILQDLRSILKKEILVMMTEVILPFIEIKSGIPSSTYRQRVILCNSLHRSLSTHSQSGRMLVELYLNYDCDAHSGPSENILERLVSAVAKLITSTADVIISEKSPQNVVVKSSGIWSGGSMPSFAIANLPHLTRDEIREFYLASGDPNELKLCALQLLVSGVLKPLIGWCHERMSSVAAEEASLTKLASGTPDEFSDKPKAVVPVWGGLDPTTGYYHGIDDPTAFETLKNKKRALIEGIKLFNYKPKKGMQFLLDSNCISTRTPRDIARFLLTAEGLSKGMIGEFLGEGDDENIAIMHAFVDEMEFTNLGFVEALRTFLQSFRLPGESQKIDRFMLKFAERYLKGNPKAFSSADTAYVLAYSVIMLNTDQHNAQVKRKMTKADFLKNNRGIDEGKDLSINVLEQIFDEINANEIVMKDEVEKVAGSGGGDDNQDTLNQPMRKLKIDQAGINLSLKTEAMFGIITRGSDKLDGSPVSPAHTNLSITNDSSSPTDSIFISATQFENVKPMFQLLWMSILMAISTPLQQSDNIDIIEVSLEGFKSATHLSCLFDLEFEKRAFLSSLTKFTVLGNISEIKSKHLEAAKLLFRIALADGNSMGEYWGNIVRCVSQLENLQLLGTQDSDDMTFRTPYDVRKDTSKPTTMQRIGDAITAAEIASQTMALSVDRIFTASAKLSGSAILDFVRALCESSWDEIKSSSDREHPRMYCLQRLVEISYYNMRRIRVEWSNIWAILGKHINQVGCHSNATVAYFALDKFRQLAMKFLELEELPNFKFQKDFLRPFEEIFRNNPDVKIKDMCLVCLQQMVNAKSKNLMSGWKAMFSTFCRAAQEKHESIVMLAFEVVKSISINHLDLVIRNYTFGDYVNCLVEFCKNQDFPKICLQSVELLHQAIVHVEKRLEAMSPNQLAFSTGENLSDVVEHAMQLLSTPILPKPEMQVHIEQTTLADNPSIRFWFPVLFGLYEVVMTCDLEVRTRALNFLFDALDEHGNSFSQDFWSLIYKGVLLPIFDDLRITRSDQSKFSNREDMSVWLSTTLILALRKFVKLFSNHYLALFFMFNEIVDLLLICMTQESETLSKIGSTCLQEFIEENATKFDADSWDKICDRLVYLCEFTMPDELFFDINEVVKQPLSAMTDKAPHSDSDTIPIHPPQLLQQSPLPIEKEPQRPLCATGRPYSHKPVKSEFQRIIFKCVLHLQVIQTLQELLSTDHNPTVYNSLQSYQVLKLVDCLFQSYKFAKLFNADGELRTMLFRMGFMKQPPNLLKQETLSISGYFMALFCMFGDMSKERISSHDQIKQRLIPLAYDVLCYYNTLDPESRKRNISAWRPVVQIILNGLSRFTDSQFSEHIWQFYHPVVGLIQFDMPFEARQTIRTILVRGGIVFGANATSAASSTYTDIPHLMTIKKTDSVIESATMTTTPTHDKPFQASSSMQSSSADMQTSCDDACVLVTDPANISSNLLAEQTIHE